MPRTRGVTLFPRARQAFSMGDAVHILEAVHCDVCGADFPSHEALLGHERGIHHGTLS